MEVALGEMLKEYMGMVGSTIKKTEEQLQKIFNCVCIYKQFPDLSNFVRALNKNRCTLKMF